MTGDAVARSYAEVLYELASERGLVDDVLAQLDQLRAVAARAPELQRALASAALPNGEKRRLIAICLPDAPPLLLHFFAVLIGKRRAAHALRVAEAFRARVERARNIRAAVVRSAVPLTDAEREAVRARLETITGARVRLSLAVDPAIIAGLVVELDDRRIDLSLRGRLDGLRQRLTAAEPGCEVS